MDLLISEIKRIRETYNLEVYIEPGEAIALKPFPDLGTGIYNCLMHNNTALTYGCIL